MQARIAKISQTFSFPFVIVIVLVLVIEAKHPEHEHDYEGPASETASYPACFSQPR